MDHRHADTGHRQVEMDHRQVDKDHIPTYMDHTMVAIGRILVDIDIKLEIAACRSHEGHIYDSGY